MRAICGFWYAHGILEPILHEYQVMTIQTGGLPLAGYWGTENISLGIWIFRVLIKPVFVELTID